MILNKDLLYNFTPKIKLRLEASVYLVEEESHTRVQKMFGFLYMFQPSSLKDLADLLHCPQILKFPIKRAHVNGHTALLSSTLQAWKPAFLPPG